MTHRRWAHGIALLFGLLSAAGARVTAQNVATVGCTPDGGVQNPRAHNYFASTYAAGLSAPGDTAQTTDPASVGFGSFTIPRVRTGEAIDTVALTDTAAFGSYDVYNHNNYFNGRLAANITWSTAGYTSGAPVAVEPSLSVGSTGAWCSRGEAGSFFFQASWQRDLRWEPSYDGTMLGLAAKETQCAFGALFHGPSIDHCMKRHFGLPVYGFPRTNPTDFPILEYSVIPPGQRTNAAAIAHYDSLAMREADAFHYGHDIHSAALVTTDEIKLYGIAYSYPKHLDKECWKEQTGGLLGTGLFSATREVCRGPKETTAIYKGAVGFLRHRQYTDMRIGVPDSTGGVETWLNVALGGGEFYSWDDDEVASMLNEMHAACGSGCYAPVFPRAEGARLIPGSDDSLRTAEQCKRLAAGVDCASDSTETAKQSVATPEEVTTGLSKTSTENLAISDLQRDSTFSGQRTDANGKPIALPSQIQSMCQARAQEDSADVANGARDPDGPPPPAIRTDTLIAQCVATYRAQALRAGGAGPSAIRASDGARAAVRATSPSTTPAQPPVCRSYYGRKVCWVGGRWVVTP